MNRSYLTFFLVFLSVLLTPLLGGKQTIETPSFEVPPFPKSIEGQELQALPLSEREYKLAQNFPGSVGRFTDGNREFILRWVLRPTRKLHPVSDCLKGAGFQITPLPLRRDNAGNLWNCVEAMRGSHNKKVCERIQGQGSESWSDVSSWFWSAILRQAEAPWLAIAVSQEI